MKKVFFITLLPAAIFAYIPLHAEPAEYSLYLELATDDAGSDRAYTEFSVRSNAHSFSIGAGTISLSEDSVELDPNIYTVSYIYQLNTVWDIGTYYERWGASERIWTNTFILDFGINYGDWRFLISPEYRDIELYSQPRRGRRESRSFHSTAIALDVHYYGFDPFEITVSGKTYDYSINPEIFDNPLAGRELSLQALSYSRGLTDYYTSVELAYNFLKQRIGFEQTRIESAVDEAHSDISTVRLDYFSQSSWILSLEAGYSDVSSGGNLVYGLAGVTYNW